MLRYHGRISNVEFKFPHQSSNSLLDSLKSTAKTVTHQSTCVPHSDTNTNKPSCWLTECRRQTHCREEVKEGYIRNPTISRSKMFICIFRYFLNEYRAMRFTAGLCSQQKSPRSNRQIHHHANNSRILLCFRNPFFS